MDNTNNTLPNFYQPILFKAYEVDDWLAGIYLAVDINNDGNKCPAFAAFNEQGDIDYYDPMDIERWCIPTSYKQMMDMCEGLMDIVNNPNLDAIEFRQEVNKLLYD